MDIVDETTIIDEAVTDPLDELCESWDCSNMQVDEDLQAVIQDQDYYINAWGATNSLMAMVGVFIYVNEVKYWQDSTLVSYNTDQSPFKEWKLTSYLTFGVGLFNSTLWAL